MINNLSPQFDNFIDSTNLSLDEWIKLATTPVKSRNYSIESFRFPTRRHEEEFLATIDQRPEKEVKNVLRAFLMEGGMLGQDEGMLKYWIDQGKLDPLYEKYEFVKRVFNLGRNNWEGTTWILDLLPGSPQLAIDAIQAYIIAHIQFIPDGRYDGLNDAITIISKKYLEFLHPKEKLLNLRPREFEYLIATLFSRMNYEVKLTKQSRDGGYDIEAKNTDIGHSELILIECKRYDKNIGVKEIRSLNGIVESKKANKGILVTTSNFTKPAIDFSKNTRIELVNYISLNRLLNKILGQDWSSHTHYFISEIQREEKNES